jgi:hypothetical protein
MQDHDFHVVRKDDALICSAMQLVEDLFPCNGDPTVSHGELQAAFECDYDKNPSKMYSSMEKQEWSEVLDFMIEGTWPSSGLSMLFPEMDPVSPRKQACMWVTRFEIDGRVQWSQIPLHAAMIYGAPYPVVNKLIELYPEGIRCTDDRGMLPLHLAIQHSSNANVLRLLLEKFPEGMFAKDNEDRGPFQVKKDERTKILTIVTKYTTQRIQTEYTQIKDKQLQEVYNNLLIQKDLNDGLEAELRVNDQFMQNTKRQPAELMQNTKRQPTVIGAPTHGHNVSGVWNNHLPRGARPFEDTRQPDDNGSEIHRLDRELRAEKKRLEEKNRRNRELSDEKRRIEDELRETQAQVKSMTKRRVQDDLRYSKERIASLKQTKAQQGGQQNNHTYQLRKLGNRGGGERNAIAKEEDNLDERIQLSQDKVNRLLQSRSRVDRLRQEVRRLKGTNPKGTNPKGTNPVTNPKGTNPVNRHTTTNRYTAARGDDEMSAMSTSIDGRSIDEMRGGLHKLMKQDLLKKEDRIRSRLHKIRQTRN